jgi:hypothetical protein
LELFLTIEAQNSQENGLAKIMWDTRCQLKYVTDKDARLEDIDNYGTEFKIISVIPSCTSKEFLEVLGWKERKQIWRKKKEADIRLFMDYERFVKEPPEVQRLMYIDILVKSIMVVQERSKGDFRGKELINDILKTLNVSQEQLSNLSINKTNI